jgi:Tfp pilus assembly protein PilF
MRSAGRVRITVQLIDAATDEHLWAETYERDLRDVLRLQSEVAQAVAGEIRVRLTEQDKARLAPARKVDPAAYDAYLRGWYFINRRRFDEFPKAQEYLQKAVALQPDYALAWAALAQCPLLMVREPQERTRQTTAAARRALELDSTLGEAHVMLGMANTYDFHWTAAEQEFRKAIELSPNSFPAHTSYAMFLVSVGRFDESLAETAKAVELDPLSPLGHFHAGICNFFSRRYAQAIAHFRKAFEIDPSYPWAHDFLAEVYEVKKMYPEALAEYRLSGSVPLLPNADWRACWETELAKSKDRLAAGQRVATFKMALTYVHLGRNGEAIEWMEKGVAERDANMGQLAVQPLFDGLRSDPRFVRLLQRMGLPIVNSIGSSCRHLSAGVVCQSIVEPGQAAAGPAPQPPLACLDAAPGFREASFRR